MCYNTATLTHLEDFMIKTESSKCHKKMTYEQLQGLMHMRKRNYVQKNGKAYSRKQKYKIEDAQ